MSVRKQHRQHSKSTLLKATEILFRERAMVVVAEAMKWKRRLVLAGAGAFVAGVAAGCGLAALFR